MALKGAVRAGPKVQAKLLLDHAASGPEFLLLGFGRPAGTPSGDGATDAPGGIAEAELELDQRGRLEVGVDMSAESDRSGSTRSCRRRVGAPDAADDWRSTETGSSC